MSDDAPEQRAAALLNKAAAEEVRQSRSLTVAAAPSEPDTDGLAFENESYRYAAEWLTANKASASSAHPFSLVLSRSITRDENLVKQKVSGGDIQRYHAFRSQRVIDVQDKVLITTMNLEYAIALPIDAVSQTQRLFNAIEKFGLSARNIATFEPSHANLILQPRGLSKGSIAQRVIESAVQPWKLEQLENAIQQFHNDNTRTPSGVLEPWSNATEGITGQKLEIRISKALAYYLDRFWQKGSVLAEVGTPSGRMDIYITAPVLVAGAGPSVIEVKVLRSHRMKNTGSSRAPGAMLTGHAEWWAKKGVIQADLYRTDKLAPTAYLCAFDAQDNDADSPSVISFAQKKNINFKRYFMYRSTSVLQDTEMARAAT